MALGMCIAHIGDKFTYYFKNGAVSFETWELWSIAAIVAFIVTRIYLGYFGNSLYYISVKKKIRQGYLQDEYNPTSILSCFGSIFYLLGLNSHVTSEPKHVINEESIRDYLNPNRRKT